MGKSIKIKSFFLRTFVQSGNRQYLFRSFIFFFYLATVTRSFSNVVAVVPNWSGMLGIILLYWVDKAIVFWCGKPARKLGLDGFQVGHSNIRLKRSCAIKVQQ